MSLIAAESPHGVGETVDRLVAALDRRGISVFARIDHGRGARAAGLELGEEELLVFGDPRVGTLLMQVDASIGYELPLRMLVWSERGKTLVGYRPPTDVAADYAVAERQKVLDGMTALLETLAQESTARD